MNAEPEETPEAVAADAAVAGVAGSEAVDVVETVEVLETVTVPDAVDLSTNTTNVTSGVDTYWSEDAGAEIDLPDRDDASWQLTTDTAPLPPLRQCLEAILLVVDEPVAEVMLAQVTERPRDEVAAVLQELAAEYTEQERGFDLRQVGGGWRLYTRPSCAPLVEKFVLDGQQAKLSQPALETLAVVAYRQPVSRSRISAVRGVNCDGVMRTLLTRGLVEEAGSDAESGAILYCTTSFFLERMGMRALDELPELAPLLPSAASMMDEVEFLT